MAKKSMLARENKRSKLVAKYRQRRNELKILIKSSQDFDTIMDAQANPAKSKLAINGMWASTLLTTRAVSNRI